jgi:aminoglycoside phosphotransferase (APT) family kinase protein
VTVLALQQANEEALRRCLEGAFSGPVAGLSRSRSEVSASYDAYVVTARLAAGGQLKIFLKDFGFSRLPKEGLNQRRERELRVYRDLLAGAGLGTARYHGSVWDDSAGRFWLLLEFVDGLPLRDCALDYWVAAAGWLGRMQGSFARHPGRLGGCDFLLRHDADFFRAKAEQALCAVSRASAPLAARLGKLVSRYDRLVAVMVSQPRTLVHGSYRPENILVDYRSRPPRVCPIDWELAAVGAPLYDLAFISDGFKPAELDRLWGAYREQAGAWGFPVPHREEMRYVVDAFRLHKVLKSLSESWEKRFPAATVAKLVAMGEGLGRPLL